MEGKTKAELLEVIEDNEFTIAILKSQVEILKEVLKDSLPVVEEKANI